MRVRQIRAVLCRVALSNLRSVTHHIYLCSSYILLQQLHVACMHVAAQPGAFQLEIVQIAFLTMATVRFSQAPKRGQQYVRISYLPVVVVVHRMYHAHYSLRCGANTFILLYVWYQKEAGGIFCL